MDLAIAIDRLRPGATYLPNTERTAIVEWRDARPQPTAAELQAAYNAWLAEEQQAEAARTAAQTARLTAIEQATTLAQLRAAFVAWVRMQ